MDLSGRVALITGGSGYLGAAVAKALAELGSDLILVDRELSSLRKIRDKLASTSNVDIVVEACDLEFQEERVDLIAKVKKRGRLDILINNAAFVGSDELSGWAAPFERQSLDTWNRALAVNISAPFHLSQGFARLLTASGSGAIVNIASIYGEFGPDWSLYEGLSMANPAAYSVSKGGLLQLTKWLATTLAPGVRVNAVSPGGIERNQDPRFIDRYCRRTPLARMAKEEDLVSMIAFLSGDAASYITGENIRIDGGWGVW